MKFNIGDKATDFSIESIRERYTEKSAFVSDMLLAHDGIFDGEKEEKAFKKALDTVWKEAFPGKKELPKEETFPLEETNGEAPE